MVQVDGITLPRDPAAMLADGEVHDVSVVFGSQTNDSQLFLFRDWTKPGLNQPNNEHDGGTLAHACGTTVRAWRGGVLLILLILVHS
jgi:hypothetical protein